MFSWQYGRNHLLSASFVLVKTISCRPSAINSRGGLTKEIEFGDGCASHTQKALYFPHTVLLLSPFSNGRKIRRAKYPSVPVCNRICLLRLWWLQGTGRVFQNATK